MFKFRPELYRLNPFCVYTLEEQTGAIQWVGISKFIHLLNTPDARKNALFETVFPSGSDIHLTLLATFERKVDAQNYMYAWLQEHPLPFMMSAGRRILNTKTALRCVETGQMFTTLTQAARHFNVTQPYISKHLRGDEGCSLISGRYTLEWVSADVILSQEALPV